MSAKTNGLYHTVLVDQMNAPNVKVSISIEHRKIEVGQEQVWVLVVVEADAGGQFNEDMYSHNRE
jgi:hypothetical protein